MDWNDPKFLDWLLLAVFMGIIGLAFVNLVVLVVDCAANYC